MGLEAKGVAGLRCGGAVVAPAVGLDDEAELGPEEIDLELVDLVFGERDREARGGRDRPKEPFQLVVGETERVLIEDRAERANAGLAPVIVQRLAQRIGVDHVALIGLIDRSLQAIPWKLQSNVEEGADRVGDRNPKTDSNVAIPEPGPVVGSDLWSPQRAMAVHADVDQIPLLSESP